jgi:hypothetical protein
MQLRLRLRGTAFVMIMRSSRLGFVLFMNNGTRPNDGICVSAQQRLNCASGLGVT